MTRKNTKSNVILFLFLSFTSCFNNLEKSRDEALNKVFKVIDNALDYFITEESKVVQPRFEEEVEESVNGAFFIDLEPFLNGGRILDVAPDGQAFTGYMYSSDKAGDKSGEDIKGFVWTKDDGLKFLDAPEFGRNPIGWYVSDDGKIVAGFVADVRSPQKDANNFYGTYYLGVAVWGQTEKPVSTLATKICGAYITGMSADGGVVVGYSDLLTETDEDGNYISGVWDGFSIVDGEVKPIPTLVPQGNENLLSFQVNGISYDGKKVISKRFTMDIDGKNRDYYSMEGKIQTEFRRGDILAGVKVSPGTINEMTIDALNHDGTITLGSFQVVPYDLIRGNREKFIFIQNGDSVSIIAHQKSSESIFPESISSDGSRALLTGSYNAHLWTKEDGLMQFHEVVRKYKVDIGTASTLHIRHVRMSRDGKCLYGTISHNDKFRNHTGNTEAPDYRPFILCLEDMPEMRRFLSDN